MKVPLLMHCYAGSLWIHFAAYYQITRKYNSRCTSNFSNIDYNVWYVYYVRLNSRYLDQHWKIDIEMRMKLKSLATVVASNPIKLFLPDIIRLRFHDNDII